MNKKYSLQYFIVGCGVSDDPDPTRRPTQEKVGGCESLLAI